MYLERSRLPSVAVKEFNIGGGLVASMHAEGDPVRVSSSIHCQIDLRVRYIKELLFFVFFSISPPSSPLPELTCKVGIRIEDSIGVVVGNDVIHGEHRAAGGGQPDPKRWRQHM